MLYFILAGTFLTTSGATDQSDCQPCTAGYYCPEGTPDPTANPSLVCPAGFWCPEGTEKAAQNPCPIGTYSNVAGLVGKTHHISYLKT